MPDDCKKARRTKPNDAKHKSDVEVVTRAVYRANGNPAYVDADASRAHLGSSASTTLNGDKPRQLTDGEFDERGIDWAPDGSTLYFASTRVAEPYYDRSDAELYRGARGRRRR